MNFGHEAESGETTAVKQSPGRKVYKSIFPRLLGEQVMSGGMDGRDHYGHWKMFRQQRSMGNERQQMVLNHMRRGLRHRLDQRIAAIQEINENRGVSDGATPDARLVGNNAAATSSGAAMPSSDHEALESARSARLLQRYSQFGVQRTDSTLSTAGAIPVDFLQPSSGGAGGGGGGSPAAAFTDPQSVQESIKLLLAKEPTFVTTFVTEFEPPTALSRQASSIVLPPIGASREDAKTLLLYVTSGLGDFDAERAAMAEHLVPHLRDTARSFGLDFQLVDPHFGCRFHASDNHEDADICQEALARAKLHRDRLNHIILIGNKFGKPSSPRTIESSEFELLRMEYAAAYKELLQLREIRKKELDEEEKQRKQLEEQQKRAAEANEDEEDEIDDLYEVKRGSINNRRSSRRTSLRDAGNLRRPSVQPPRPTLATVAKTVGRARQLLDSVAVSISKMEQYLPGENFLNTWYYQDTSRNPAVYRLAQVSSVIPEFSSYRQQAQEMWYREDQQLLSSLAYCARRLVSGNKLSEAESAILAAVKTSVLEKELRQTVLRSRGCQVDTLVFMRTIDNFMGKQENSEDRRNSGPAFGGLPQQLVSVYTDLMPGIEPVIDLDAVHHFTMVKMELEPMVPEDAINRSQITLDAISGISPERSRVHDNYVKKLCSQIIRVVEPQIRQIGLAMEKQQTEQQNLLQIIQENENYCLQQ